MKVLRAGLWVGVFSLGSLAAGQPPGQAIPPLHGQTLSGARVDLPAQLRGKAGVLVLGFAQSSQDQTKAWGLRLAQDYYNSPTVDYYEVAVVAGAPKFLRGMILGKVAEKVSERGKVHFTSIDDHEKEWRAAAGYDKADDAYVLVLDGAGMVRWRFEGPETEASYAQMKQHVEALVPGR